MSAALGELGAWLRESPPKFEEVSRLLAPEFRATRLTPETEASLSQSAPVEVFRARFSTALEIDSIGFVKEFRALLRDYEAITVAEFHVVAITQGGTEGSAVQTVVDYDLVGPGVPVVAGSEAWPLETGVDLRPRRVAGGAMGHIRPDPQPGRVAGFCGCFLHGVRVGRLL